MDEKNSVTCKIFGSEYTIIGTESKEYIKSVCDAVDEKMRIIADRPNISPLSAAVLCSINFCDELFKSTDNLTNIKSDADKIKQDMSDLNKKLNELMQENDRLRQKLNDLRSRNFSGNKTNEKQR